jgi:hypothetical protein
MLFSNKAFIQKEVLDSDILNPVFVPPGLDVVFNDHNLFEGIRDTQQRRNLLFPFVRVVNGECRLDIITFISPVDHKIYILLFACIFPVGISDILFDNADIHVITPADQIVVKDIFHEMRLFQLPESKPRISQADIRIIVFDGSLDILPSLHIVPLRSLKQTAVYEFVIFAKQNNLPFSTNILYTDFIPAGRYSLCQNRFYLYDYKYLKLPTPEWCVEH